MFKNSLVQQAFTVVTYDIMPYGDIDLGNMARNLNREIKKFNFCY